ncbi:hypothetical protein VB638_06915 [Dolichospermum sp. UHCC 0684]|jgi:hypothetical protein|uniref:hypothetical protein n=1 Tax=Nostocales TaxID=1161 RepID=UPI000311D5F5|nr:MULTISPECIES: hypothetical protein [Nostocales]MBO1052271.1 hypothetical protein [Dolichospermum sp. DET73]MEA5529321.1 hypothetical protein [Dolichospermum sp. UHCC 0684]MTJ17682.1 hypothetical protein [Dolichospermum sp. UHCC 0299]MTJ33537.1 hypothetical protein [Dolichospermum sp. UHCC 0260]MTJ37494.1 hypothetical protein [Dolichospermum sp. UHCC 0406]
MITEVEHQSSLILITQEKCADMDFEDEELSHIQYLLKTVVQEKVLFNLSAVFKEYLQMR